MDTRQAFYEYVRLLESRDAPEKITKMIESQKREGQSFWRVLANYTDFRSGKTLLMYAASANNIELSNAIDAFCNVLTRDASGRVSAHYAAAADSVEWMHNFHKRHGQPEVFFVRDSTQQRPVDTAGTFNATRSKRWIEMLQAEEVAKAGDTLRQIMGIISDKKLVPVAIFDYLAEMNSVSSPTLPSEGGTDATQNN